MSDEADRWVRELVEAGWKEIRLTVWESPTGAFYRGPHGAWKVMTTLRDGLAALQGREPSDV